MAATASVRVSKRRERNPATTAPEKVQGTMPQAQMYGIYGPQYAAALNQTTAKNTGADTLNRGTLANLSAVERNSYAQEMERARIADAELQKKAAYYGILSGQNEALQGDVELGMGGARGAPIWNEEYGVWSAPVDDLRVNVANADVLNTNQAERFGTYAGAVKNLRDSGVGIEDGYMGKLFAPPTQPTPVPIASGTTPLTPGDQTQRYAADEGLTAEEQFRMAEINKAAKENGDDVEGALTIGANGVAQVVYKGSPEALAKYGIDPVTGRPLNPKAGAVGGAAPATPAAKPVAAPVVRKPTPAANRKNAAVVPIRNGRNAVAQVYPQLVDQVTEVERPQNATYGAKNSWHKRTKAAIDMRPIKGMTFNQYVQGYRDAGYEIIEALNEVGEGRSKGATGDHWHVVLGENKTPQVLARRIAGNPNITRVDSLANGDSLVTLKDGTQRVYRKGKRIG